MDVVIRELESMIDSARRRGLVTGEPDFRKTKELKHKAHVKFSREVEKKLDLELKDEFPHLDQDEIDRRISYEAARRGKESGVHKQVDVHKELKYNFIAIRKVGVYLANLLGLKGIGELKEFLNYEPDSIESQVFDREISF